MFDTRFYKLYMAFLSQLSAEIKEKYPELSEDDRRIYLDIVINRILLDPLRAVGSVSELRDSFAFVHDA